MPVPLCLALALWVIAIGTTLWGTWYALRQFSRPPAPEATDDALPPVSILKPLKGVEPGFGENIGSFFCLDYPRFEMLFSVADPADPAVAAVQKLIDENPQIPCRLLTGATDVGPNPKVNNLLRSYQEASHEHLLISDSNVRVTADYLRRVVAELGPDVGVVTAVVAGQGQRGIGGWLEATYLNSFYARWMHLCSAVGHAFVVGKSMLFRRSTMERFGGLALFGRFVNEDYMAGEAFRRLGLRVVIMRDPIPQFIGAYPFRAFWSRHLRWGRIRKAQAPVLFFIEPLIGALASGLFGALVFSSWLQWSPLVFFALHTFLWMTADFLLMRRLGATIEWRSFTAWCLRECLALPLWLHMAINNSIDWRGNRLRILPGGLLETGHDG